MGKTFVYVSQWNVKGQPSEEELATNGGAKGGVSVYELAEDGHSVTYRGHFEGPARSSCLTYVKENDTMYIVHQTKGAGRNAWQTGSTVWACKIDHETGMLKEIDRIPTMGGNPEAVSQVPGKRQLCLACTGGNDHVEKIIQTNDGTWTTMYEYDDGAISMLSLKEDGTFGPWLDVQFHRDHGPDPSTSVQHNGRCQITGHPHSCTIDPTGKFLVSGDKGNDKAFVYKIHEDWLELACTRWLGNVTGGRHVAFDPTNPRRFFMTTEYSSELLSFDVDEESGGLHLLDRISTIAPDFKKRNEPATLRVNPNGKYIYLNNRGEDDIVTVEADESGKLTRKYAFQMSRFEGDPVNATRQFEMSPDKQYLFVGERPANLLHVLKINDDGTLSEAGSTPVINPTSVCFVQF